MAGTKAKGKSLSKAEIAARVAERVREAGQRALAEAEARRAAAPPPVERPKEYNGPKGPEPTRYGDWEKNGIASDF